jgi:hypothetical protein
MYIIAASPCTRASSAKVTAMMGMVGRVGINQM